MPPYAWGFPFGGNFTGFFEITKFDGLLRSFTRYRGIYGRLRAFTGFRGHGFGHDVVTGLGGSPVPVIGMWLRVRLVVYGGGFPSFHTDP